MSEHELWNELGNLYFMSGAYNQAANAYQRSIRADTEFGRPYSNLALTYVQQGKYDDAIELYRRSIELLADAQEKAISLNRLGGVYRHLKDYSRAVIAFQQADELDPRSAEDFPPAAPPRVQAPPVLSSVLDQPVTDIIYDAYEPVEMVAESLVTETAIVEVADLSIAVAPEEPVTQIAAIETVDQPIDVTPEEPVAESSIVETADQPIAVASVELVAEMGPVETEAETFDLLVAEVADAPVVDAIAPETDAVATALLPIAAAAEEPVAELSEEPPAVTWGEPEAMAPAEWINDSVEEPVAEAAAEPHELTIDERMTRRMGFLVGEALDQAAMTIGEQPVMEKKEPEIDPELEWWDVDDERLDSATQSHAVAAEFVEDPSTSWTPADFSQFQHDVSQMPETGSLTTWSDPDFDDDFERWAPSNPYPDESPDADGDNISTWLPIPEEAPITLDELHIPPFFDELEAEPEPPSEWNRVSAHHAVRAENVAPILPNSMHAVAAEATPRNEAALGQQRTWEPQVDVAVQERPAPDFTVVPQQRPSRVEVEPAPRPAQPELVLAPAMPEAAAPEPTPSDRDETEMREIELGIEKFRRVVQLNPRNAHAWDALGTLYKSAGMYKDAIMAYQQAISNDSSKSLYYHHLGLVYACEGRDEDAITAFQRVIEIDPEYSLAHATLGGYYRKMGYEELAQKHIGKAMKNIFDSENEYNRACLEAICGNADNAIKLLDVALKNKQTYVDWILRDPDLDFIRQDPRFKQLVSRYTR